MARRAEGRMPEVILQGANLFGTSLYLTFQAILLRKMFKACSIQSCEQMSEANLARRAEHRDVRERPNAQSPLRGRSAALRAPLLQLSSRCAGRYLDSGRTGVLKSNTLSASNKKGRSLSGLLPKILVGVG